MRDVVYHEDPSMRPSGGWSQNPTLPLELDTMFRHYNQNAAKSLQEIEAQLGGRDAVTLLPSGRQQESTASVSKFQLFSHIEQPAFLLRGLENTRQLDFPLHDPLANVFNPVSRDMNTVDEVKSMYRRQFPDVRSRGEARHIPTFLQNTNADPSTRRRFT